MSAPVGIVGFDYILGPTAYLVFALLPEYWGRGIMHRALRSSCETWQTLQKHHCKSQRLQQTRSKIDSEIAFQDSDRASQKQQLLE